MSLSVSYCRFWKCQKVYVIFSNGYSVSDACERLWKEHYKFFLSKGGIYKEGNHGISLNLYFQHHPNLFITVSLFLKAEIVSSEKNCKFMTAAPHLGFKSLPETRI